MKCFSSKNQHKPAVVVSVRRAEARDNNFLFQLRNEEAVRAQSWHTERVRMSTHERWFRSSLQDPRRVLYVIEADGVLAGQVRFDIDNSGASAEVGVSVTWRFRGRGVGNRALRSATQLLLKDVPDIKKVFAHIKPDNMASVKAFLKAGYEHRGIVDYKGRACVEMVYEYRK